MTKLLFIGNSFVHRHSKDNSIPHCYSMLSSDSVAESIHEGKSMVTFYSERKAKILADVKKHNPDIICISGGIPKSSWYVASMKLLKEIKKVSSAKIYILAFHHASMSDANSQKMYRKLATDIGGTYVPISSYISKCGLKKLDTDKNHPSFVCYYMSAVLLYSMIHKTKASTKATYKAVSSTTRTKIVDTIAKAYVPSTPPKASTLVVPQPTLKKGSKGTRVKQLQMCLNHLGANLKLDGDMGNITVGSLKSWQNKYGLKPDGVYGKLSYAKMKSLI